MVTLELDDDRAAMLAEILESFLGDLRAEIAGTDSRDFREELKLREVLIKDLLGKLGREPGAPVPD